MTEAHTTAHTEPYEALLRRRREKEKRKGEQGEAKFATASLSLLLFRPHNLFLSFQSDTESDGRQWSISNTNKTTVSVLSEKEPKQKAQRKATWAPPSFKPHWLSLPFQGY